MRRSESTPAAGLELGSAEQLTQKAPAERDEYEGSETDVVPISIPPAILGVIVLAFLFLLSAGIWLLVGGKKDGAEARAEQQLIRSNAQEEKAEAQSILQEIQRVLEGYNSATTVEEILPFVRHPERVSRLMEGYYENQTLEPRAGAILIEQTALPLSSRSFSILGVAFDNHPKKFFLAEVENDLSVKIDWESDVAYQDIPVERALVERPIEPFMLRVYVSPDTHYVYEFSDTEQYQCFKLTFRDSEEYLFGYARKGSAAEKKLREYFTLVRSRNEPMILTVSYPENAKGDRYVAIEEFVEYRWAYAENPDDE